MLCFLSLVVWYGGVNTEQTIHKQIRRISDVSIRTILKIFWKDRTPNQALDRMNKLKEVARSIKTKKIQYRISGGVKYQQLIIHGSVQDNGSFGRRRMSYLKNFRESFFYSSNHCSERQSPELELP